MEIINYLKQAFPKAESKWKIIVSISLFVPLFLIIFQPFGITLFKSDYKILILSGYGFLTFCILIINLIIIENIFIKFFDERNWTVWKEFVWLLWVICTIGLGNAFYSSMIFNSFKLNIEFILSFQFITIVVAIIPITVLIVSKQKYFFKKHMHSADVLNENLIDKKELIENNTIRFFAENEKDSIEFDISDFYFIESSGNYIELFLFKDGKIIRKTFRSTLKRALEFFSKDQKVIQCHRAFIVNSDKIKSVKGNSQGLKLSLENCTIEVPVSRGFVNSIREIIN